MEPLQSVAIHGESSPRSASPDFGHDEEQLAPVQLSLPDVWGQGNITYRVERLFKQHQRVSVSGNNENNAQD